MASTSREGAGSSINPLRLMYERPAVFMSMLKDERGESLAVEPFHEEWLGLFDGNHRVVILAPRGHGKTTVIVAYLLWSVWRHNRHPDTGRLLDGLPAGRWEAVLFSATMEQVSHIFELFKSLMIANETLFADTLPDATPNGRAAIREVWSRKRTRLRNRTEVSIRAYGTSTRGLHPDLILLDDVLSDENSGSSYQRDQTSKYFMGTVMPMDPTKLIVIGTAFHYGDLLHRLKPKETTGSDERRSRFRFAWHRDQALTPDSGESLWPGRYSVEDLLELREIDPVAFSREYMNEPADDVASLFPFSLTERMIDERTGFARRRRPDPTREVVVLGYDPAASAETGADYCCLFVIAVDKLTLRRRVLWAYRERGLGFDEQLQLLRDVCRDFGVLIGMVEDNGFQRWLKVTAERFPETAGRVFGHTTGRPIRSTTAGRSETAALPTSDAWRRLGGTTLRFRTNSGLASPRSGPNATRPPAASTRCGCTCLRSGCSAPAVVVSAQTRSTSPRAPIAGIDTRTVRYGRRCPSRRRCSRSPSHSRSLPSASPRACSRASGSWPPSR